MPSSSDTPDGAAPPTFFAAAAHELRSRLNTLNGFLEIVLDARVGPLTERQREFLGYARASGEQLAALVEDMLLLARADAGDLALRAAPVAVSRLVEEALGALAARAEAAQVRLATDFTPELPVLLADGDRLRQALANLVAYAIARSRAGGEVRLSAEAQGNEVLLKIHDMGPALTPEEQERVFSDSLEASGERQPDATGLGLAAARLIVEAHGGHVWVESAGQRTTFCVSLLGHLGAQPAGEARG